MSEAAGWRLPTPDDDAAIRSLAGKISKGAITARLEISEWHLRKRAEQLGISFRRKPKQPQVRRDTYALEFTDYEKRIVRENMDTLSYSEIARLIGRSRNSVAGHIYRLKRKQRRAP